MVALFYSMDSLVLFESIVYRKELPEYVDKLIKVTNDHLLKARKNTRPITLEREKKLGEGGTKKAEDKTQALDPSVALSLDDITNPNKG